LDRTRADNRLDVSCLSLFSLPEREPSSFIGFAGNRLDRQSEMRADDAVATALADPKARLMLMAGGRTLLKVNGESFDPHFRQTIWRAFPAMPHRPYCSASTPTGRCWR
jgi:NAD+ diphosphatase